MNLAIVSNTASDTPFLIPPNDQVRGYAAFACMFPDDKAWNVSPRGFKLVADETDVIMFIPSSDAHVISDMVEIAQSFPQKKLVQDSDPPTGWLWWFPSITAETTRLFEACDVVVAHSEKMLPILSAFTRTPVRYLPEPSYLATYKKQYAKKETFQYIITATTHCATYNSNRNAMMNYAILKQLMKRFEGFRYGVMANTVRADAGESHFTEYALMESLDISVEYLRPANRYELFKLLTHTVMLINMDYTNAVGHWQIDAAATKTPVVCTDFPDASKRLFPQTCLSPFDLEGAVAVASRLIENAEFYRSVTDDAYEAVSHYSYDTVRRIFCDIVEAEYAEHKVIKGEREAAKCGEIVLELGSGGKPHEDATHCLDVMEHDVGDRVFIRHDMNHLPLPFESGSVSKIYICHALEHLQHDRAIALVDDMRRVLKPGGILHVEVPNVSKAFEYGVRFYPDIEKHSPDEMAWGITGTLWGGSGVNAHRYGWNHFTLMRMLHTQGFEVISCNEETTWAVIVEARRL